MLFFTGLNWVLRHFMGEQASFLVAYLPAVALHFALNKYWTFGDNSSASSRQVSQYLAMVAVTFVVQWSIFTVLVNWTNLPSPVAAGLANAGQMAITFAMMSRRIFAGNSASNAKPFRMEPWLVTGGTLLVLWFFAWTVWTSQSERWPAPSAQEGDYFNMLSHGFMDGHLYLKAEVPRALIEAEDPYDPAKRPGGVGLHDVSYYLGHYYLYFGAVPVVALFTPFRLLTGDDLPQSYGNLLFASLGFLCATQLWLTLRRRYFPESGSTVALLGVLSLGCCGMVFSVLRRASIWELPISAGYAFAMLALLLLVEGIVRRRATAWWIFAGLAMGLAIGSRPSYMAGALALPLAAVLRWWQIDRRLGWRPAVQKWIQETCALGFPCALVVGGLLFYNFARFGDPMEFGLNYQLTGLVESKVKHFSSTFIPFNAYIYYLAPAQWGRYFPFIQFIRTPPQPPFYYGFEYPYGVLVNMPVLLLALLWPCALIRRKVEERRRLTGVGVTVSVFFLAMALFLAGFVTGAQRYMVDFTPSLVALAMIGLLAFERLATGWQRWIRAPMVFGAVAVGGFSIFFGVMTSFQLHGIFPVASPETYRRVAYAFNVPSYLWEKVTGFKQGPLEISLRFPKGRGGAIEPLVSTGWEFYSDHIYIHYLDEKSLRIGMDHTSHGTILSAPQEIDFDREHVVRVEMGSLYPPEAHPFFAGKTEVERASLSRWLRVMLDGKTIIEAAQSFYESAPENIQIGKVDYTRAYGDRFTGTITSVKRGSYKVLSEPNGVFGPVGLKVLFPTNCVGRSQPLLATGKPGAADTFYVMYTAENRVKFGYDHWGAGALESPEVEIQHSAPHGLVIRMPSLASPQAKSAYTALQPSLLVVMDDRVIWAAQAEFHPTHPSQVYFARNGAGASVCEPDFTGTITAIEREREAVEPKDRRADFVAMKLVFPKGKVGQADPLFGRGIAGAADMVIVKYRDADHISFGLDHWGIGLLESELVPINMDLAHDVSVRFENHGSIAGDSKIVVRLDGRVVWETTSMIYPATPESVTVGLNRLGASTCNEVFGGVLVSVRFQEKSE